MLELLSTFDALADQITTTEGRLAVTVGAVGAFLLVLLSYRQLHRWLTARLPPLYVDILLTVLLVLAGTATVAVSLGVWGQTAELRQLYVDLGFGGETIAKGIFTLVIAASTYILMRFLKRVIDEFLSSSSAVSDHQQEVTYRVSQITLFAVTLVVVLGVWIDDLSGLLVGAGVLGIIIGMAARQTLGTILSGFVLMFSRPFEIGDWIEVEDREGIVTDISIINTRIRSFDGEYVMIPNDLIAASVLTNRTKQGKLRVEIDVGVDYETDVAQAGAIALDAVENLEESMAAPAPDVITKSFGDSAVILGVRFWIESPSARRWARARTNAINAIKRDFEADGIKIPYPQREVSDRDQSDEFRTRPTRGGESEQVTETPHNPERK